VLLKIHFSWDVTLCRQVSSSRPSAVRQRLRPQGQCVQEECLAPEDENSTILRHAKDCTTVQCHIPPAANFSKVAVKRLVGCLHLFRKRSRVQTSGRMTVDLRTSRFSWVPPNKLCDSALKEATTASYHAICISLFNNRINQASSRK